MADPEEGKKEEKSSTGKWWEFYVVRYALGTVFGVLIVDFLTKNGLSIPFPEGDVKEIAKAEGISLLIAYGLAYCYLASSPILLFHATRFSIKSKGFRHSTLCILIVAILLAGFWAAFAIRSTRVPTTGLAVAATVTIFFIVILMLSQVRALIVGTTKVEDMWIFYLKLDKNRRNKRNKELVDSYRHLREHGNAFFVVILELLLGLALYISAKISIFYPGVIETCLVYKPSCAPTSSTSFIQQFVLLVMWIIPAAVVWVIGCFLEAEFANDSTIAEQSASAPTIPPNPAIPP